MKTKNRMKNKQIAEGCKNEAVGENIGGDVGVVGIDEVKCNEIMEVDLNTNRSGEEEIIRKAVELDQNCSGEDEINLTAVVEVNQKCSGEEEINRMAEVELNQKCGGEEEINRKAEVELEQKYSGEEEIYQSAEVDLNQKCSGEEEINRKAEDKREVEVNQKSDGEVGDTKVDYKTEVLVNKECIGEVRDRKVDDRKTEDKSEVESNGKFIGEEQGNRKAEDKMDVEATEIRNVVERKEGEGVGEVNEKQEGGVEVNTVTMEKKRKRLKGREAKRKRSREIIEAKRKIRRMRKEEREMKGEVNEKCDVDVIEKMDLDAGEERDLVQKDEDGGGVQMPVKVADQKQDLEGTEVKEMKLSRGKKKWLKKVRLNARRLLEEANQNKQEAEKVDKGQDRKEGEFTYVEKEDGEAIINKVGEEVNYNEGKAEGEDGDVKEVGEIAVEKQVGEASRKDYAQVVQEKEMKRGLNEKHEEESNDRMDIDAVEGRDLVQKDEQDRGGMQMLVEVTNQTEVAEATTVNKMKLSRGHIKMQRIKTARSLMEEANQNKQDEDVNHKEEAIQHKQLGEEAASTKLDGLESDLRLQGKVHIHMQKGQAQQKQEEEVNYKEGEATKFKKKTSKQLKQRKKVDKVHVEKQEGGRAVLEKQTGEKAILGNQWRQIAQKIDEDSRDKLISVLNQFRNSKDQEYTFDATLTKFERAAIHLLCRKMGMGAKSFGSGSKRCITVFKRRVSGKKTRKNNITRFMLSEEAKDVSLNLFTQYPPYDCGSGDKMATKFVGRTNKRRKTDPFFERPLMSKFEIRRKVELLASKLANDPKLKQITEKRTKLPIASFRDAITSAIDSHQVVLISGETGCGKTTQVPQYVLDHLWSKSETCKIVCTQPRRISAVSVAGRIAFERGENIGDSVGYKIKMESAGGINSSIIFCTTGVLLRVLVAMGSNSLGKESSRYRNAIAGPDGITHIIVDEVHERDHFSDLLLAIVRDLLPINPNIRLVLMSATIDAERFSQYFGGCPVIKVPGFTYPVKTFYLEDILSILRDENNHLESASRSVTSENFLLSEEYRAVIDDAITLAWSSDEYEPLLDLVSAEAGPSILNFQHSSTGVTPLMVFARKGRVGELCMTLALGADCYLQDNDGATAHEWAKRENQKEAAEILKKHMENSVMNYKDEECLLDKYLATVNSELVDFVLVEKLLKKICTDSTDGAILVFFTGWDDIQKTIERLQRNSFFKDASKFLLLALHSKVPSLDQKKVFERPPPGCRKIVLSTNIAESSITIDDVVYVINTGRMKEKSYDPYINVSTLLSSWISKASAKQRAGRAGRCRPGICYHLYSKIRGASFLDFQVPEVKRMPLEELCLQVKILDPVCKINEFLGKLLDPPVTQSITNAISVLQELGALSPDEELTELGYKLGSLPVHPILSKMLFFAILLNCLDPALTLASVSSYRDPFYQPMDPIEKKKAISARLELASLYGGHGDQLAVIAAYECWKIAKEKGEGARFCSRYFLSPGTMRMVSRMRKKFLSELYRKGFIPKDGPCCNLNAHDPGIRNAVLLAGFYPMVGRLSLPKRGQRAVVETAGGVKVRLTSNSANNMTSSDDSEPLVIFDEIVRGDGGLLVKNCSVIGPLPLLLLAKEIMVTPYEEDDKKGLIEPECPGQDTGDDYKVHKHKGSPTGQTIMSCPGNEVKVVVDRWLTCESTALDVAQICCLRERLSAATLFKIRNPFGTQSKMSDASLHSIARILSYDGLSGIPSTLGYKYPQASETSATEAGKSELRRKKGTSAPDSYLTSLVQQYHAKNYDHHLGKASICTNRDSDQPAAYCNQP